MWIVIVAFAISAYFMYGSTLSFRSRADTTALTAQVDNLKITEETFDQDYQNEIGRERQMLPFSKMNPLEKLRIRKGVLDQLINDQVLSAEAQKNGIQVTHKDVQDEIDQEKVSLGFSKAKDDQSKTTKKDTSWSSWFQQATQGDPQDKAYRQYVVAEYGSYDAMVEKKQQDLLARHFQSRLLGDAKDQLEKEANKKADDVIARLNKGEKFEDLAAQLSEDPSAKTNKGDLGSFGRGRMVPEFEDPAFSMKVGEIRKITSQYGVHIIQVLDHKYPTGTDFDKQKAAIRQKLLDQQKQRNQANGIATPPEVTDDMVKRDYEQVHARHILFRVDPQTVVQQKIEEMRQKHNVHIYDDLYNFNALASNADTLRSTAQLPQANDAYDQAIAVLQKALEKHPDSPDLNFYLGDLYQRKFETYQTLQMRGFQQKPPSPPDPTLIKNLNDSLDKSFQYYKAAVDKSKIGLEPDPYYFLMLGRTYSMKGDMANAASTYQEGLDYTGKDNMLMLQYKQQVHFLGRKDLEDKIQAMMDASQKEQQEATKKMNAALSQTQTQTNPQAQSTALPGAGEKKNK